MTILFDQEKDVNQATTTAMTNNTKPAFSFVIGDASGITINILVGQM